MDTMSEFRLGFFFGGGGGGQLLLVDSSLLTTACLLCYRLAQDAEVCSAVMTDFRAVFFPCIYMFTLILWLGMDNLEYL